MAAGSPRYTDDVPDAATDRLRTLCLGLPEAHEERAWRGTRWAVRKRTFAHVLGIAIDDGEPDVVLVFRSEGEELEVLRHAGRPYLALGWGREAMGIVLDADTDWDEVAELVTDSYCLMAPQKLAARVDRPA